jgi:hypothetical protein
MDAGLAAFMAAPSSRLSQNYDGIVSKRTPKTRLAAYCNIFGEKVSSLREPKGEVEQVSAPTDQQALIEAVLAALNGQAQAPVSTDEDEEVTTIEVPTSDEFITSGVAWACLGGSISPPNDMTKAATNGQLFAMNSQGLFSAEEVARLNVLALGR